MYIDLHTHSEYSFDSQSKLADMIAAAEKNGVHYYPILVNHEKESWDEAITTAFSKLQAGEYAPYGQEKKQQFLQNLGG